MKRYEEVAATMRQRIEHGLYRAGDRLPSIRELCAEFAVSISTVQTAYAGLEAQSLIEARPKSGYFVLARTAPAVLPGVTRPAQRPLDVSQWDHVLNLVGEPSADHIISLGRGIPDVEAKTLKPLFQVLAGLHRSAHAAGLRYDSLAGSPQLRKQLARLASSSGCLLDPDDILISTGCQEALSIAIRTLTVPGDVVAVDLPSFYGSMQILKAHQLKAMEIPTDPENRNQSGGVGIGIGAVANQSDTDYAHAQ